MKLEENNIKCDGCATVTKTWNAIDNWCIRDGKHYCMRCQEEKKIGWYTPGRKRGRTPDDVIFAI